MRTILVVDDSATMRRMVIAALAGLGDVAFDQAASGLEAVERLALAPPDLVLLDLNMPDMHGLEVLRFIRSNASLGGIPVAVLTTVGDEGTRDDAVRAGATAYLTKPFRPETLVPEVERLLPEG